MINQFQKFMTNIKNRPVIWEILRMYHPELFKVEIEYVNANKPVHLPVQASVSTKYDWVCIELKNVVSIGIEFQCGVIENSGFRQYWGTGYKLEDFIKCYETSNFKCWRFCTDSQYQKTEVVDKKVAESTNNPDINFLLAKHKVPRPAPTEMYNYYYED